MYIMMYMLAAVFMLDSVASRVKDVKHRVAKSVYFKSCTQCLVRPVENVVVV